MPIPQYIILLGYPGSGKSTQGKELAAHWGRTYISTGDALRGLIDDPRLGPKIKTMLETGALATDELMLPVVEKIVARHPEGIIFDGFPRRLDQALWFERHIADDSLCGIFLDIPAVVAGQRLFQQRRRDDDTPAVIDRRHVVFRQETRPLLTYYDVRKLLHVIDANRPMEEIFADCLKLFN